ncbi:hypothetical protein GMMP1_40048 [Candidatus Magnetomoraceae bacterium gMMP-1]
MKKLFLIFIVIMSLSFFVPFNAFSERLTVVPSGEYVQDEYIQDQEHQRVKAKMEVKDDYIKVTVEKYDEKEDEYKYKFRCDGHILVQCPDLIGGNINLSYDNTFSATQQAISYKKDTNYVEFYFRPAFITDNAWEPSDFQIRINIHKDTEGLCSDEWLTITPFTITREIIEPELILTPSKLEFSKEDAAVSNVYRNFSIKLIGAETEECSVSLAGNDANQFELNENDRNFSLTSDNSSHKIGIKFRPTSTGTKEAIVKINGSNSNIEATGSIIGYNPEDLPEKPVAPYLIPLSERTSVKYVNLCWQIVLDSTHKHNADYYEIEYYKNYQGWSNAYPPVRVNGPFNIINLYQSISHTIPELQDDTDYYFRVRAVNQAGAGPWSNVESTRIDVQDYPVFMENYPDDNDLLVSKTPALRWSAHDPENDELEFYLTFGTSQDDLRWLRSFNPSEEYDFATESNKVLTPDTTYYWQVWVREKGRSRDYYQENFNLPDYPMSPILKFTTEPNGSNPAITKVELAGELQPASKVLFKVTVKNYSTETAAIQNIASSYIKNGNETPFWSGSAKTSKELEPGEEEVIDVEVEFRDDIWEKNGITYDNMLISGDSEVKFYFSNDDNQDTVKSDNELIKSINYVDAGGPVIDYFQIRECGQIMHDPTTDFWARAGQEMTISIQAHDDVMVKNVKIEYRLNVNDDFNLLKEWINDDDDFDSFHDWLIPEDIQPTDEAQIKLSLYDDQNNETVKITPLFSIYSNRIDVSIQPIQSSYKLGDMLDFTISNDSDYNIKEIRTELCYGSSCEEIYRESDSNGITIQSEYQWSIPDRSTYISNYSYLNLEITDIRYNTKEVQSSEFKIEPNTELPPPFNESITLYDEELSFPEGALQTKQDIEILFVKIDENNLVHAVVGHYYRYFLDTASGNYAEDTLYFSNDKYYLTYDDSNGNISSKIKICDKNYNVLDFSLVDGKPYALIKKTGDSVQYYYTYKQGSSFVNPINLENSVVPEINSVSKIDQCDTMYSRNPAEYYIYANGYVWVLDFENSIGRYSFANGYFGNQEYVDIQNSSGSLESYWVDPVSDGNYIYFIDTSEGKFVRFNMSGLSVNAFSLPFEIDRYSASRVCIAAMNGKVFIFGNGKVYSLENSNIVEKGNISYSFNEDTVDYSSRWNNVNFAKAVTTENKIIFMFDTDDRIAKPRSKDYEILEFDINTNAFVKQIVEVGRSDLPSLASIQYIGNNKLLILSTSSTWWNNPINYSHDLKILDLETGAIEYLGEAEMENVSYSASLIYTGNGIYVLGLIKIAPYHTNSYKLTLNNITTRTKQVDSIQFFKDNDQLYATWAYGNVFDGTWNFQENQLNNRIFRRNKFVKIYPTHGSIKDFSDEYIGAAYCNIIHGYLSNNYGEIFSLNSDLTFNQKEYEHNEGYETVFKTFNNDFIAGFTDYDKSISLIKNDLSSITFDGFSKLNEIAVYDNEVISIGRGTTGEYYDKNVVIKKDLQTDNQATIVLSQMTTYDDYQNDNYHKVDINQNKYAAVAWDNLLTVADLSGDIVPPQINFTSSGGEILDNTQVTLSWSANDNNDELVKYEIYQIVDGNTTLLDTITDINITSYNTTVNSNGNNEIEFKITAYDNDGNMSFDSLTFQIIIPVEFTSFSVNKSSLELGEKLIFTWAANGISNATGYTVYKKKIEASEWDIYFNETGKTNKEIIVDGFVGDYQFKIEAGEDSEELAHSVYVEGEIVEFDYSTFSNADIIYYVEDKIIDLNWGIETGLSDIVTYEIYVKNNEGNFNKIASTTESSLKYVLPEDLNKLEWKIIAEYKGVKYESNVYQAEIKELISPDVTELNLLNNNTLNPAMEIKFNPVEGVEQYAVMQRDSNGFREIARIYETTYIDNDIQYERTYEYSISSVINGLVGEAGNSREIFPIIMTVQSVIIQNEDYASLDTNALTVTYLPNAEDCYENYEIMIGTDLNEMQQFGITQERSIYISDLEYGNTYYVEVYPLDHKNKRVSNLPAKLTFDIPFNQVDSLKFKLCSDIQALIGTSVSVPLTLINLNNTPIQGLDIKIEFDQTVLEATGATLTGSILENKDYLLEFNSDIDGKLLFVVVADKEPFTGNGIIAYLHFNLIGNVEDTTNLSFSLNEVNETPVSVENALVRVNAKPTISDISDYTINKNNSIEGITFTIGDEKTPINELQVTGSSSDTTLIPNENIVINGSGSERSVTITPAANVYGTTNITLTVSDGSAYADSCFKLRVNDPPTITNLPQYETTNRGISTDEINFKVQDIDSENLTVSGSSSNTQLVPDTNITITGSGENRSVKITPALNQHGTAVIILTVSDGEAQQSATFDLIVNEILVQIQSDEEGYLNTMIDIPFSLTTTIPAEKINVTIHFDKNVLNAVGADLSGGILENKNYDLTVNTDTDGQISLVLSAKSTAITGSGVVANLLFEVSSDKNYLRQSTELGFVHAEINNSLISSVNGLFTIIGFNISGNINYFSDPSRAVRNTILTINGDGSYTTTANEHGNYTFYGIPAGSYELNASKSDDLGGLSGLDASIISRHAAELYDFNCHEKITADVTDNGSISGMDRSRVARYVVEKITCLNDSCIHWRFIPEAITNCNNWPPISYSSHREFTLDSDRLNEYFIGVRLGDVTGNWVPNQLKSSKLSRSRERNHQIKVTNGSNLKVPIILSEVTEIEGIDIKIEFDENVLNVKDITLKGGILEYWNYELSDNTDHDGQVVFTIFAMADVISSSGEIAFITFNVVGDINSTSDLYLTKFECNESSVSVSSGFYMNSDITQGIKITVIDNLKDSLK